MDVAIRISTEGRTRWATRTSHLWMSFSDSISPKYGSERCVEDVVRASRSTLQTFNEREMDLEIWNWGQNSWSSRHKTRSFLGKSSLPKKLRGVYKLATDLEFLPELEIYSLSLHLLTPNGCNLREVNKYCKYAAVNYLSLFFLKLIVVNWITASSERANQIKS